jgi:hypothetical protein
LLPEEKDVCKVNLFVSRLLLTGLTLLSACQAKEFQNPPVDQPALIEVTRIVEVTRLAPGSSRAEDVQEPSLGLPAPSIQEPIALDSTQSVPASPNSSLAQIDILVDDFSPQPYQGDTVYYFNRLEGDRGALNDSALNWANGQVTTTIGAGKSWGGLWMSLNHPIREAIPINFSAILPSQIRPAHQSQIIGIQVLIAGATPNTTFRLELKNGKDLIWQQEAVLNGGSQNIEAALPALGNINQLVLVLDRASPGNYVALDSISLTASTAIKDAPTAAFVWSYGMLLNNWNPSTGLVRDKAREASGEFDAIQATGSLAATTALAEQIGIIQRADAVQIINKISSTLQRLPRLHGLWPHWVKVSSVGKIKIVENTEWSSVDTVIAALGLLEAQNALGLDTKSTEKILRSIDWKELVIDKGISHGYTYNGELIPYAWDTFGGESWLVELAYAAATGKVAALSYASPPTANGSGFIDELAWMFLPPPNGKDAWGTDWAEYRSIASFNQIAYIPLQYPASCPRQFSLFGLSASEVPSPSAVSKDRIYQAFGKGGRFATTDDGSEFFGKPVIVPHYSAMVASTRQNEAIRMWTWLINSRLFTPLTNVESMVFPDDSNCSVSGIQWNHLKGSWNLSLQTLGWGNYLAQRAGQTPVLWKAVSSNTFLNKGYALLTTYAPMAPPLLPPTPPSAPTEVFLSGTYERQAEYPDEYSTGQSIPRSNASESMVHGQIGTTFGSPWSAVAGYVKYTNIPLIQGDNLELEIRYSKYSPASAPVLIYLDNEAAPRAAFYPTNQGDWNRFAWSEAISLGSVEAGIHSIKFYTDGEQYGILDLDMFALRVIPPAAETEAPPAIPAALPTAAPTMTLTKPPTARDLLVWYDFEGDFLSAGKIVDRSGHGFDAQISGAMNPGSGVSGTQGIYFSGDGYIQSQNNPASGRDLVSFSLWFNTNNPGENYKLASAAWWNGGPACGWIMATHVPEFWSDDTQSLYLPNMVNLDNQFKPNTWIHEVVTYDSNHIKEYTNGQLINEWETTGAPICNAGPMAVGAWPEFSGYNFLGSMDEFRIYGSALTQQEVQALYAQGR